MAPKTLAAAEGRWPEILMAVAGLTSEQLTNRHQPCPHCGGKDRYRWTDDDGPGSWYCNQCGGRDGAGGGGTGMGLLMRIKGWDFKQAAAAVDNHLGIMTTATKAPCRIPETPPTNAAPPALDRAVAQWCYRNAEGNPLFWIQRLNLANGRKLFVHCVWLDGGWHRASKKDGFTCSWPTPRPLYNLHLLARSSDAPVLLVEGEKAADAASILFPGTLCLSWPNGSKSTATVDWTPLAGRRVTLWPDNDDPGRQCMAKLAPMLLQRGVQQVRIIHPPADMPPGWDLADASWTQEEAKAYVLEHRSEPITLPEPAPAPPAQPDLPSPPPIASAPFTPLGYDPDGGCFYQIHATGTVTRLARSAHTSTNLVSLAPLAFWETLYPSKAGTNWTAAASDLFEQQALQGMFNPDTLRGRGAWWDRGRSVLSLGDRLIVDGITRPIRQRLDSDYHYQRGNALHGPGDLPPLTDEEANQIQAIAERFHWEQPASANLLAGWAVLAPISGALQWRPHIWLTAAAGSGKSAILERFVGTLLADIQLPVVGNTSEAFIRQALRSDALPVLMDEAESNEKADQQRIQSILALARFSSSETRAIIGKGSANGSGGEQRFRIRSMFFLSSISTAVKQGADGRRFAQLTLRTPAEMTPADRQAHWFNLDRDIERVISPEAGRRLIARTVSLMPVIRENIKTFTRLAALHFGSQGLGDQYGTLLAGSFSLMSSGLATKADAMALIALCDVGAYTEATEVPDERRCLDHIAQHQLRVDDGTRTQTRTIYELVELANRIVDSPTELISPAIAAAALSRHGLRVSNDHLMVSNTAKAIAQILADTPWRSSWPTILTRLPGAQRMGVTRFPGLGVTRATSVPLSTLAA
jgi:putative DNA primase/helicase